MNEDDWFVGAADGAVFSVLSWKIETVPIFHIIMFTARAQDADVKMGEEVGAEGYITKPFEEQVLLTKIKELLRE